MKKAPATIVALLCLMHIASAQTSAQFHGWYMYFGNHRLTDRWGIHTEYQFRRNDGILNWQQSLMRVGIDYRPMDHLMLTAGYGHIITFPYGDQPVAHEFTEHRLWQQALTDHDLGRVNLCHRFRLEQRWLEKWGQDDAGAWSMNEWEYRNRVRYQLFLSIPLNHKKMQDRTVFIGLNDELFVQFGEAVKLNVLDQNRAYAALGYRHSATWNVQLGYLNQWIIKADRLKKENNHTIQLAVTYNIDLRPFLKKKE
jgi:hypothetical protein